MAINATKWLNAWGLGWVMLLAGNSTDATSLLRPCDVVMDMGYAEDGETRTPTSSHTQFGIMKHWIHLLGGPRMSIDRDRQTEIINRLIFTARNT